MPQQRVLEDSRLAVIAAARQRAAAYGVDARQLCRDLVEQVRAGSVTVVGDEEGGTKGKRRRTLDAGSLVVVAESEAVAAVDEILQPLDSEARRHVYRRILDAQPATSPKRRRLKAPDECLVCMEPVERRVYLLDDDKHRCAVTRGAMCVDCTSRLLSQRSPVECPLCREPLDIERLTTA